MSDYKLVPVEPTEEMRVAGLRALHALGDRTLVDGRSIVDAVLMAALAAAPPANGRYSQGVCGYSPVVLCDGRPITIDEIVRRLNAPPASAADEDDLSWLMNAAEGGHDNIISCGMARRIVRALDPDALQLAEEPKREMRDSVESIVQAYATADRAALAAASQSNQPDELARLEREIATDQATQKVIGFRNDFPEYVWNGWLWREQGAEFWPKLEYYLRYFELRGLLERHHDNPNLVQIKERGDE